MIHLVDNIKIFEGLVNYLNNQIEKPWPALYEEIDLNKILNDQSIQTVNTLVFGFHSANNPVRVSGGEYAQLYRRVVINVYTSKGVNGVIDGDAYCSKIEKCFGNLYNTELVDNSGGCLYILNNQELGSYHKSGKTKQGIQTYTLEFLLTIDNI